MAVHNAAGYNQTDATNWTLEVILPLIIMLILLAGVILMSFDMGRSERSGKEIAAFETYARYSQQIESISARYSNK